jgi:hypothetical protein
VTTSFTSDELQRLLKFPFEDPRWTTKFLIGSALILVGSFLLIPLIPVYGYSYEIMRRIIVERGQPYLPEWDDWGKLFVDGLKLLGVYLIYILPFLVFFCAGYGVFMGFIFAAEGVQQSAGDPETAAPLMTLLPLLAMVIWLGSFGIGMLGIILVSLIIPVAAGHVIATGEFAAAFRVREWWPIFRANWSGYVIAYVLILGIGIVTSFVMQLLYITIVLCCLVPFITVAVYMYMAVIGSVLFGQAYRIGTDQVGLTTPNSTTNF